MLKIPVFTQSVSNRATRRAIAAIKRGKRHGETTVNTSPTTSRPYHLDHPKGVPLDVLPLSGELGRRK